VADLAVRGLGIAILSESMTRNYEGRLQSLIVEDIQTPAILALIWKKTHSPPLRELLIACQKTFTDS
jgi:DNA-binding transcriptional LysR family regulator